MFMARIHPVSLVTAFIWACTVLLAMYCSSLSATAGHLPDRWVGIGMIFGMLSVALVIAGVWFLPASVPRIVQRLIQLAGMAGAFWAVGTLTRALYALTV